jgi:hypothetical protein
MKQLNNMHLLDGNIKMNCSICNEKIEGFGNNAQPINDGRCCDDCNTLVIIERIKEMSNDTTRSTR